MTIRKWTGAALTAIVAASIGLAVPEATAQTAPTPPSAPSRAAAAQAGLSRQDKDFLIRAGQGDLLQIELGRVASARGNDPQVKQSATRNAQGAGKAQARLGVIAAEFGVRLPRLPPPTVMTARQRMEGESAAVVDRDYVAQILPASNLTVNQFSNEAQHGRNPVVAQFARQMLPQLEQRREHLLRLSRHLGVPVAGVEPIPRMKPTQRGVRKAALPVRG